MRPRSVQTVPAGKRPKLKNRKGFFEILSYNFKNLALLVKSKGIRASSFIIASSFILITALVLQGYYSHYVYVVVFDGREIGSLSDIKQVETLIDDLTTRVDDYYGMPVEPGNRIKIKKDYRPEAVPDLKHVEETIKQEITFLTDAYLLMVDDVPLVPVASETVLEEVVSYLEGTYLDESEITRIIDISVVEDLSLRPCSVAPKFVFSEEEIIALLMGKESEDKVEAPQWFKTGTASIFGYHPHLYPAPAPGAAGTVRYTQEKSLNDTIINTGVTVQSVEELVVTEPIPFDVEVTYDEEMWVVQNEIATPGQDGRKEIVYHVTRINGEKVGRVAVKETVISEPVTQAEIQGTAQVPSKGTGQFIWPVAEGGEVTPGRGFSSWHTGIDIDGEPGTPILAADSGVVWYSGFGGSQGNYIIIYHGNYWTLYLHNQINLVKKGKTVKQGDVIARLGSTGRSTGPHLHFEIRRDDGSGEWRAYYQHKPVDPLRFFRP